MSTTWLLVTTKPSSEMKKPEPRAVPPRWPCGGMGATPLPLPVAGGVAERRTRTLTTAGGLVMFGEDGGGLMAADAATGKFFAALKASPTGILAGETYWLSTFREYTGFVGWPEYRALEEKYLPSAAAAK